MRRLEGIHLYINIENFDQIVADEEDRTGTVTHSIHALDTFFSSVEGYGKSLYGDILTVEKITGSRLHLYIVDTITMAYSAARTVSVYAFKLAQYINKDIPKYKTLKDFTIQIGCAYGHFYDFEFETDNFSETTTIGFAANFAAKLQALTGSGKLSIFEDIYRELDKEDREKFEKVYSVSIKKYGQSHFYTSNLSNVTPITEIKDSDLEEAKIYANKVNLNEIEYSGARQTLNFSSLSKSNCKRLEGIPLFADIRGFTSMFDSNDTNLDEMAEKTRKILLSMYNTTLGNQGVHVQFQGDRELSVYQNTTEESGKNSTGCFKRAVLSAMRLVDAVKPFSVHIGVGEDFGRLYATKIGARGEKDNILIGKTVITADCMEDVHADEDQIAITGDVYRGLKNEDSNLAKQFSHIDEDVYVSTAGFAKYQDTLRFNRHSTNTEQRNYNGAWGVLE